MNLKKIGIGMVRNACMMHCLHFRLVPYCAKQCQEKMDQKIGLGVINNIAKL
jgi:hypothetical protein